MAEVSRFEPAVAYTLTNEGRLSEDRNDRGGLTKWGIVAPTLATYQRKTGLLIGRNVASLSQAEAIAIYRALYWRYDGITNQAVATKLFDYGVNVGLTQAVLFAQRGMAMYGATLRQTVVSDGLWGPATLSAINLTTDILGFAAVLKAMCYQAAIFYTGIVAKDSTQLVFIDGWLARAARRP